MVMRNEDRPDKGSAAQHRLQANYTIEDKINVINYHKKIKGDPGYKMKDYEKESILRQYGKQV